MKIFFTTTPRLKIKYNQNIEAIFNAIDKLGYKLTNDYLRKVEVENFYQFDENKTPVYYGEVLDGFKRADVIIFETSLFQIHKVG